MGKEKKRNKKNANNDKTRNIESRKKGTAKLILAGSDKQHKAGNDDRILQLHSTLESYPNNEEVYKDIPRNLCCSIDE